MSPRSADVNSVKNGHRDREVQRTYFADNSVADIRVVNSHGVVIQRNVLTDRYTVGAVGIALDATSDANLISFNSWNGTSMNTAFVDNGSGNCRTGTTFAVAPCP